MRYLLHEKKFFTAIVNDLYSSLDTMVHEKLFVQTIHAISMPPQIKDTAESQVMLNV